MQTALRVSLILVTALAILPDTRAQSFAFLRRELQKKYSADAHSTRMTAAASIGKFGDLKTLRFAISRIRRTSKDLAGVQKGIVKITDRLEVLDREIRAARRKGSGSVNRSDIGDRGELSKDRRGLVKQANDTKEFLDTLRFSVGRIFKNIPDENRGEALETMTKAYKKSRDEDDKLVVLRVIVSCDSTEVPLFLNKLMASKVDLDRLRVLVVAEDWGGKRAMRLALTCLEDPTWQLRAQAIRVLKKVGGKQAANFLVAVMVREDGRLKTDAIAALCYLTGQNFRKNQHLWKNWIADNAASISEPTDSENAPAPKKVEVPEAQVAKEGDEEPGEQRRRNEGGTGFYGIETTSKHIVYVLDFSGSMSATGGKKPKGQRRGMDSSTIQIEGNRRIDRLANELIRSVSSLSKDSTFNIVVFTGRVKTWRKKMVFATQVNKKAVKRWILGQAPGGSTNLFGGLEEAFGFAGRGSYDQAYNIAADTIFLLSDGSPTAGRLTKTEGILAEVRKINALKRIAIHGVYLGKNGGRLLQRLAAEHDGQFVRIAD